MNFRVGQRVVCVDASHCYMRRKPDLVEGHVYVVLRTFDTLGGAGVLVDGAKSWHPTGGYRASRFRPAVERKTDTSVFTKILDDVSRKVPVAAVG
jgi:hypothetical protein